MKPETPNTKRNAGAAPANPLPPSLQPKGLSLDRLSLYAPLGSRSEELPKIHAHDTSHATPLGARLPTAAQRLRYEAVLEAVGHMGEDVVIQEYRDYATCTRGQQFAAIRPNSDGGITVGIASDAEDDMRLTACVGKWGSARICAQFELEVHQPIRGWQLGLLRRSYLAS